MVSIIILWSDELTFNKIIQHLQKDCILILIGLNLFLNTPINLISHVDSVIVRDLWI